MDEAVVVSVGRSAVHSFSKPATASVVLIAGLGVEGDAHAGTTTQHRYLAKKKPGHVNLTQVHLIDESLFAELAGRGFEVGPGDLGENITTAGVDLITLPLGTLLHLGEATVEVTGLRSPCSLINKFRSGLMKQLVGRDDDGHIVHRAGIMGIVVNGGIVAAGTPLEIELPVGEHLPLSTV